MNMAETYLKSSNVSQMVSSPLPQTFLHQINPIFLHLPCIHVQCCNVSFSRASVVTLLKARGMFDSPLSYCNSYHECDMHILHHYQNTTHITSAYVQTPTEALKSGECLIKKSFFFPLNHSFSDLFFFFLWFDETLKAFYTSHSIK